MEYHRMTDDERTQLREDMLTYLFDPDKGLRKEIEEKLAEINGEQAHLQSIEEHLELTVYGKQALMVVNADAEYFNDVWRKIKDSVGLKDKAAHVSQMHSDITLNTFLTGCGQRSKDRQQNDRDLAVDLVQRGWRMVRVR